MSDPPAPAGRRSTEVRLRVRPPRPLEPSARWAVAAMVTVIVVVGGVVLHGATSADQAAHVGAGTLDRFLPPAGAVLDPFDGDALGDTESMRWTVPAGAWFQEQGALRATGDGTNVALVDPGQVDVLIDALVVSARPGSGIVVSDGPSDRLELVVGKDGNGWQLVRTLGPSRQLVQLLPGPVSDVVIQVVRRADSVTVSFDREAEHVSLPAPLTGTSIGLVAPGSAITVDRFAYLELDGGR